MADISQYTVSNKELAELLLKHVGIHEGKWMVVFNFGLAAGNFGPTTDAILPTALVSIQNIGIQRAQDASPPSLVVDAAEVNPPEGTARKRSRKAST